MTFRAFLRRLALTVLFVALALGGLYLYATSRRVKTPWSRPAPRAHAHHGRGVHHQPPATGPAASLHHVTATASSVAHTALTLAEILLLGALSLTAVSVLGHLVGRYLRRPGPSGLPGPLGAAVERVRARWAIDRRELVLGREDHADPYQVARVFDDFAELLRPLAKWRRFVLGPDPLCLQILSDPATRKVRFTIGARHDRLHVIEHRLRSTYPDARLVAFTGDVLSHVAGPLSAFRHGAEPCPVDVVRLKKARRWLWALQTTRDYAHSPVESLLATLAGLDVPAHIEWVLTPAPKLMEARVAHGLQAEERSRNAESNMSAVAPGVESVVVQQQMKGASENIGRSLFLFDIRVAVPHGHRAVAGELAGVLSGGSRSDNELRRRTLHVRRRLYASRLGGTPPLLAGIWTQAAAAAELATLWHLPSLRIKGVGLQRASSREILADPVISRDPHVQLLEDELGPLGLEPDDLRFGLGVLGAAGGGKTALLLRLIAWVSRDVTRSLIVVDPKEDLARDSLTVIPPGRQVHILDLGEPLVGLNPLTALRGAGATPEVVADIVISAFIETFGRPSIGARSDQFLRNAIQAVCVVESTPTLWHVYRMLDAHDPTYRNSVVARLEALDEQDFLCDFWARRFAALYKDNAKFAAEALEAPLNKLARFLGVPSLALLTNHEVELDLVGIVQRQEVLVVNGAKGAVGEDNAVLVCQLLVGLVQKLLHQQQHIAERGQRGHTTLVIDEAHNLFTPSFATMLSEGRSGGLECCAAFQYTGQIEDDRVKAGIKSLLQNMSIFRLREFEDARNAAALAMSVFSDTIRGDAEDQQRLRLDPVDITNLPTGRCVNLWLAGGRPQPAFTATTLPIETLVDELGPNGYRPHHERAQAARGYHPHHHGHHIRPPLVWNHDEPALSRDDHVYVDLGNWAERPQSFSRAWLVLTDENGGETLHTLQPWDRSGLLWRAHLDPELRRLGLPGAGTYRVGVQLDAGDGELHEAQITVRWTEGETAKSAPATMHLAPVARRTEEPA